MSEHKGRRPSNDEEAGRWLTAPLEEGITLDKDHDGPLYEGARRPRGSGGEYRSEDGR